jgi:flagellar biosynthesis protein FliQ
VCVCVCVCVCYFQAYVNLNVTSLCMGLPRIVEIATVFPFQ